MDVRDSGGTQEGGTDGLRPSTEVENHSDVDLPIQHQSTNSDYGFGSESQNPDPQHGGVLETKEDDLTNQETRTTSPDDMEAKSSNDGGGQNRGRTKVKKKRRRNPRMLLLDFNDGVNKLECLSRLKEIVFSRLDRESVKCDELQRGGLRLTFATSQQRKRFEERIRTDGILSGKLKGDFISKKRSFQVMIDDANKSIQDDIETNPEVISTHLTPRGRLIISVMTLEKADQMVREGYESGFTLRPIKPWVRTPTIGCRSCGSMDHRSCDQVRCFKCGEVGHRSSECSGERKCLYCSQDHDSRRCPRHEVEREEAFQRKKKSYRDALVGARTSSPTRQVEYERTSEPVRTPRARTPEPAKTPKSPLEDTDKLIRVFINMLRIVMPAFLTNVDEDMFDLAEELIGQALSQNTLDDLSDDAKVEEEPEDNRDDDYEYSEIQVGGSEQSTGMDLDTNGKPKRGRSTSPDQSEKRASSRLKTTETPDSDSDITADDDQLFNEDMEWSPEDTGTPAVDQGTQPRNDDATQPSVKDMFNSGSRRTPNAEVIDSNSNKTLPNPIRKAKSKTKKSTKSSGRKSQTSSRAGRGL